MMPKSGIFCLPRTLVHWALVYAVNGGWEGALSALGLSLSNLLLRLWPRVDLEGQGCSELESTLRAVDHSERERESM